MIKHAKSSPPQLIDVALWRNLERPGLERFELFQIRNGWLLRGTILIDTGSGPAEAAYKIVCDSNWLTREADISLSQGSEDRHLHIAAQNRTWYEDKNENKTVAGAIDIDLGWTPSTNTLPIRRLKLALGESSGPVTAAWINFPDLRLQRLPQQYKRLAQDRYLYTSRNGAFQAEIVVNDHGVVLDYENYWRRVDHR